MLSLVAIAGVLAVIVWLALPRLPGRVRQHLPKPVAGLGVAPLPQALPAPARLDDSGPGVALLQELAEATPVVPVASPAASASVRPPAASRPSLPTPAPEPTAAPVLTSLPPYGRIAGVPIVPQKFNNCGPTNLTLVLNYYGVDVDQFDVAGVARPNYEDRNVSPDELIAYVNEQTMLEARHYVGGDVDTLRRLIAAGFPVIIEKGLEPDEATGWMGHYLTIYGYDDVTRHLYVRDTYLGPWKGDGLASYDATARYWAQFNGAFIVVYPPERTGELGLVLGPDFGEPGVMWAAAAERARAAARRQPDDPFAWYNLGSSLTALAANDPTLFEPAAAAFDQARLLGLPARMLWYQFAPYEAYLAAGRAGDVLALTEATLATQGGRNVEETWLYRGRALRLTGDEAAARDAFARAVELNPTSAIGLAAGSELDAD